MGQFCFLAMLVLLNTIANGGLIGHWTFDDQSNPTRDGGSGNHPGSLEGNAAFAAPGKMGAANILLDGNSDYITMGTVHGLERTNTFSLAAWIKGQPAGNDASIVGKMTHGGYYPGYELHVGEYESAMTAWLIHDFYGRNSIHLRGSISVLDGTWHYVTMTYDGSSTAAGVKLYVDGRLDSDVFKVTDNLTGSIANDAEFCVGARFGTRAHDFCGSIDDVRIYDTVLTAQEISGLYNPIQSLVEITETDDNTTVQEGGLASDTYSIRLLQRPTSNVNISLEELSNPPRIDLSTDHLTFTSADYETPQAVSVLAIDNGITEEASLTTQIRHIIATDDTLFNNLSFDVTCTILDNDCGAWGYDEMDFNRDCLIDLNDFALMVDHWLACTIPNRSDCLDRRAAAKGTILPSAEQLPPIKPLLNFPVRDTCIILGGDGNYYLTGTTGCCTWWTSNDGIRLWRSSDLETWARVDQPGDNDGLVWNIETEGTWAKQWVNGNRAVWAPEIHYIRNNYWITYCMNYGGTGILQSTTGLPEGPYVDVKADGPLTGNIDASLFQDDDGIVYFVWQNGRIWQMNDSMNGFVGDWQLLTPANNGEVGYEGAYLEKLNGRYYLLAATTDFGRYDCAIAVAENVLGPYGNRYVAVPHGGHNTLYTDKSGQLWSTIFGSDGGSPIHEHPGMLKVKIDENNLIVPAYTGDISDQVSDWHYTIQTPSIDWTQPNYDDSAWKAGSAGFGTSATSDNTLRTTWNTSDIWLRRKFELSRANFDIIRLSVNHGGNAEIYMNNIPVAKLTGKSTGYVQIDLSQQAQQSLRCGVNIIAVHCENNFGVPFIDVSMDSI